MSNYNNKNQLALPESFEQEHINEVKNFLRSGESKEDTLEIVAELMSDYINDNVEELPSKEIIDSFVKNIMPSIIDKAIIECLEEQKDWPEITDCDKLSKAFEEMNNSGIVARENFTCCQTCGSSEIGDYAQEQDFGYVFYHQQDTERAVEGDGVYLSYGHLGLAKKSMKEMTNQIIQTLEKNGLNVVWNGSVHTRILVNLDWKKRIYQ